MLLPTVGLADSTFVPEGEVSGMWTPAQSPLIVQGNLTVPEGGSLFIDRGVRVYFDGPYKLIVLGELIAGGVTGDSVVFTTDTLLNSGRWKGIRFLSADSTSWLESCVIEYGRGFGDGDDRYGGGIEVQNCRPTIRNSSIRFNRAVIQGGGFYCRDGAAPRIDSCTIAYNFAQSGGGGIFCRNSTPVIDDCVFLGNSTALEGGGLRLQNGSSATVNRCRFESNAATLFGGGVYCVHTATAPTFTACTFISNLSQNGGGFAAIDAAPRMLRGRFVQNTAMTNGGGCWLDRIHSDFENTVWDRNTAQSGGGGVFVADSSTLAIAHATFSGNAAPVGAAICLLNSGPVLQNSVISNSLSGEAVQFDNSLSTEVRHCIFGLNLPGDFAGDSPMGLGVVDTVNLNGDPCDSDNNLLMDPLLISPESGDLRLQTGSPCISAAEGSTAAEDLEGSPRPAPAYTQPDIGAYESAESGGYFYVCGELSGTLGPGDVIVGCDISIEAGDSLTLLAGTRFLFAGRYAFTVRGRLNALGAEGDSILFTRLFPLEISDWRGVRFIGNAAGGSLNYCIFEHVRGEGGVRPDGCGAIYCSGSSPQFSHSDIRNNVATYRGGGVASFDNAYPSFSECMIRNNIASGEFFRYGGGVAATLSGVRLSDCMIRDNHADYGGGGLYSDSTYVLAERSQFMSNSAVNGGGVYCHGTGGEFRECSFEDNLAASGGGGAYLHSFSRFTVCTFLNNQAQNGGGALLPYYAASIEHSIFRGNQADIGGGISSEGSAPLLANCVILENSSVSGAGIAIGNSAPQLNSTVVMRNVGVACKIAGNCVDARIGYCDFFENSDGNFVVTGLAPEGLGVLSRTNANDDSCDAYWNLLLDPLFINWPDGDFHLQEQSPCINAGDPARPNDPDGTITDIGAFPYYFPYSPNGPFDLISPADHDTVRSMPVQFCWSSSYDPDAIDTVTYRLIVITESGANQVAFSDTCGFVDLGSFGIVDSTLLVWYVKAYSLYPDTSSSSLSTRYLFYAPGLATDERTPATATSFGLQPAYPNPFNARTTVRYTIAVPGEVHLSVFDLLGREVETLLHAHREPGEYSLSFDAANIASGLYLCRLASRDQSATQKLMILK